MTAISTILLSGLLVFGVWLLYASRHLIRLGLKSYRWPSTEATVVNSRNASFGVFMADDDSLESNQVTFLDTVHAYVYVVGGRSYRSTTYCFGGWADRAGAAYSIGETIKVYYDPKHPETAVVRRGVRFGAVFGLVPIGAALLGILLAFAT